MKIAKKAERALDRKKETEQKNRDTVLLILSVGFLAGGVLGCLLEGKLSTEHYIGQFFQQAAQMSIAPSLWREVWIVFRWPVAVILLSQLPLAGVTIPVVFFLRGFFLSYGIVALMEGHTQNLFKVLIIFLMFCLTYIYPARKFYHGF